MEKTPADTARVAVVTGAADGIGWATAQRLAADGWLLALQGKEYRVTSPSGPGPLAEALARYCQGAGQVVTPEVKAGLSPSSGEFGDEKVYKDVIRQLGCRKIQGYYFGRPMPALEARGLFHGGQLRQAQAG